MMESTEALLPMPRTRAKALAVGKLPPATLLRAVYPYLGRKSRDLLIGPGIGRDSAAIRYDERILVISTDPITGTVKDIGSHSVYVNANDIATAGARPKWYLCTLLLPPGTAEKCVRKVMAGLDRTARALGITVVGGHTEITGGVSRPTIAGFMIGEAKRRVYSSAAARQGDAVLMTKTAGLEGTAIIASDHKQRLKSIPFDVLRRARLLSKRVSVLDEALAVASMAGVHAMHDPTEGGVENALWELAEASSLGIKAWADNIPVAPETMRICMTLALDPLRLMSSGSLLVAVQPSRVGLVSRKLEALNVPVSRIATLTGGDRGRYIVKGKVKTKLRAVPGDELYKLA